MICPQFNTVFDSIHFIAPLLHEGISHWLSKLFVEVYVVEDAVSRHYSFKGSMLIFMVRTLSKGESATQIERNIPYIPDVCKPERYS